jgi:hypothetical protein
MSVESCVRPRRFALRGLWLSIVAAASVVGGSILWANSDELFTESASVIVFRARPSMSRQPRPVSAPLRHFDRRMDTAVVLIGIEALDQAEDFKSLLPLGEWTPVR